MSNPTHWLMFNEAREVVGCHCGFVADDEDEGYGDSVVDHLLVVELTQFRAATAHKITRDELDDWIASVHDWHVRRFNPLSVPHHITHAAPEPVGCRYCGEEGGDCGFACC